MTVGDGGGGGAKQVTLLVITVTSGPKFFSILPDFRSIRARTPGQHARRRIPIGMKWYNFLEMVRNMD